MFYCQVTKSPQIPYLDIKVPFMVQYLLARDPEYPQRVRVASVFELSTCSLLVCKFSNFSSPHPPLL